MVDRRIRAAEINKINFRTKQIREDHAMEHLLCRFLSPHILQTNLIKRQEQQRAPLYELHVGSHRTGWRNLLIRSTANHPIETN